MYLFLVSGFNTNGLLKKRIRIGKLKWSDNLNEGLYVLGRDKHFKKIHDMICNRYFLNDLIL